MTNAAPWDLAATANCGLLAPAKGCRTKGDNGTLQLPLCSRGKRAHRLQSAASNIQRQALSCSLSDEYPAQKATGDPARES